MKKVLLIISLVLCLSTQAKSQGKSVWLGAGAGVASPYGAVLTTDFNVQTGRHLYFNLMADVSDGSFYDVAGIGIGAGYIHKHRSLVLTISSGATIDTILSNIINEPTSSIGVPVKVQVFTSTKFAGIGLQGILKFSQFQNYGGIGLIIGLGKMR